MRDSLAQANGRRAGMWRAPEEHEKMVTGILAGHHAISGSKQRARYFLPGFRSLSK
jgi:hypothetical protein